MKIQRINAAAFTALLAATLAGSNASAAPKYDDPILTLGSTPEVVAKGTEAAAPGRTGAVTRRATGA